MKAKWIHVTLHDVSPRHEKTIMRIHDELVELGVTRYSMLVVPDFWGKWPLEDSPAFCEWLRELSAAGTEMILHGYYHRDSIGSHGFVDRVRSALFTRGEGEFLGLACQAAAELLEKGKNDLERILKTDITGFTAPAWLYSRGTLEALSKGGFTYAESRWRTWNPATGDTYLRVPVVNYAGGSRLKRCVADLWVTSSRVVLGGMRDVRFAIHPADFENEITHDKILKYIKILLRKRTAGGHALSRCE